MSEEVEKRKMEEGGHFKCQSGGFLNHWILAVVL